MGDRNVKGRCGRLIYIFIVLVICIDSSNSMVNVFG